MRMRLLFPFRGDNSADQKKRGLWERDCGDNRLQKCERGISFIFEHLGQFYEAPSVSVSLQVRVSRNE